MSLSIAMTILLSNNHEKKLKFADRLLNYFVESFGNIYGQHFISHNMMANVMTITPWFIAHRRRLQTFWTS